MANWKKQFENKLLPSLEEAAKKIQSGDRLFCGETVSISYNFLDSLYDRRPELSKVLIMYNFGVSMANILFEEDSKKSFRIISVFTSPVDRMSGDMGILEFHSCPYEYFIREVMDVYECDTMVVEVCPPDEEGYCNVGVLSAPFFRAFFNYPRQFKKKIAVVNNMQSPAQGAPDVIKVKADWFDYLVEDNHEMPFIPMPEPTEIEMNIGERVMEYIHDGDTVQIGLGGLGDAITGLLSRKRDIKLYTEITVDSVIPAVECGAVTKITTCGCWGTPKIYDFISRSPRVECRDLADMIDPFVISQNDNLACINCTLMIDLLGQACSEAQGIKQYSSVGGSFGYLYGASRAKGGRSFLCLRSAYTDFEGESRSSVVPWLPEKSIVTTPKYLTMYVVTEFGVADIFLRTNKDRIKRMIKIAHPKFINWLKENIVAGGQITEKELLEEMP